MAVEYRVAGPPGTGKSRYLAERIATAAEKWGRTAIAVSSFTRAAARVIASRVDLSDDQVATLHAHAWRALGRPPIAEGLVRDWNARAATPPAWRVLRGRAGASRLDDPMGPDGGDDDGGEGPGAEGDVLLHKANLWRARMEPRDAWPEDVRAFEREWAAWKAEAGALDFTDLLERALADVERAPGDPAVGFFDETQDFSPLELALVRKWGSAMEAGFMLAGDPDQVLYSWRGAHPRLFHEPPLDPANYRTLARSFRVPEAVHAVALEWIGRSNWRVPVDYLPRERRAPGDEGSLVRMNQGGYAGAGWRTPERIVDELLLDLERTGRSQMVLASCAFLLAPTIRLLRERGVPFHNPWRTSNGAWNPLRGGAERVLAMLRGMRPDLLGDRTAEPRWWTWGELWRFLEPVKAAGIFRRGSGAGGKKLVEAWAQAVDTRDRVCTREELAGSVLTEEAFAKLGGAMGCAWPWRWLRDNALESWSSRLSYALAVCERSGPAVLAEEPRVAIGTCHSVKGAESARVVLFPDLSPSGWREWIGGDDGEDAVRRTFYVGMTRAREELVLVGASQHEAVSWSA